MASSDWFPKNRNAQIEMGKGWYQLFSNNEEFWKVPEELVNSLGERIIAVDVEMALPKAERNAVSNARLKMAFDEFTKVMRDIKRRFIFSPPFTDADMIALNLKPIDREPTPVGDPTGQAEATIIFPGRAQLMLIMNHVAGTQRDPRSYYGYRIHYGIYSQSETMPESGPQLGQSRFTRRKKLLFNFLPADTGKTAFFSIRYENSKGAAGPWGPMFSALIP